jgi:hypothetical protein
LDTWKFLETVLLLTWSLLIILLVFLAFCLGILIYQSKEVYRREEIFTEALWKRRHILPLLIEAASPVSKQVSGSLIATRDKLQSGAYTLDEEVDLERQVTKEIQKIFQAIEVDPVLRTETLLLSLQKEHADVLSNIRITQNDYNFFIQKWHSWQRLPFFRIFGFCFKITKNNALQPI